MVIVSSDHSVLAATQEPGQYLIQSVAQPDHGGELGGATFHGWPTVPKDAWLYLRPYDLSLNDDLPKWARQS
jgi:hypothetical protein